MSASVTLNLPTGWVVLGSDDVLPRLFADNSVVHDLTHALPFYSDGSTTYAMTIDASNADLTRRAVTDWTDDDYETYGAAWTAYSRSEESFSKYSSMGYNVSEHQMAPTGGLVYTSWSSVIVSVTNDTTFVSQNYNYYDNSSGVEPLSWTVAIKMQDPTPIPHDVLYNSSNPLHSTLALWAGFVRKNEDGSVDYRHPEDTRDLRDLRYIMDSYDSLRADLTDSYWYRVGAGDNDVFVTDLGPTRPPSTTGAFLGFIRPLHPIGGFMNTRAAFEAAAGSIWDSVVPAEASPAPDEDSEAVSAVYTCPKQRGWMLVFGVALLAVAVGVGSTAALLRSALTTGQSFHKPTVIGLSICIAVFVVAGVVLSILGANATTTCST